MATESCSPFACYARRNYGDSYFYVAGSFAKNNSIILFNKYPKCVMPNTEEEQYSLVIEIDTEKTASFEYEEVGRDNGVIIYRTHKTIYLNPIGCKFLFESDSIRDLIVSRAKVRSLDAKMLFYSEAGCFFVPHLESFTYGKEYVESCSDVEFDEENLSRDKKINKCKGFLYAYLLGGNTSPGEGVSSLQQIHKELSNLIHARIINNDFSLHTDKVNELQNQFVVEARKYDIITKELSESAHRLNGSSIEMLQKELENLGLWDNVAYRMFSLPKLSTVFSSEQWGEIEAKMKHLIERVASNSRSLVLVNEIPLINEYLPTVIPLRENAQEIQIYTEWISILLNPECNLNEFFANKLSYLKKLGIAAKRILGDERFAHSLERTYYNGLIRNIRDAEDFELSSFKSNVWQALAVCAKTTNADINALYSLMTSFAIQDYRCAVAMWGALCGYADMPKTFFNRINEGIPTKEAYEYVRCITKRIHGYESGEIVPPNICSPKDLELPVDPNFTAVNSLKEIVYKHMSEYEAISNKKIPKRHRESIDKALSITSDGTILSFLMKLNDFPGFTRKAQMSFWTYLKDKACPQYDIITSKVRKRMNKMNSDQPALFNLNDTEMEVKKVIDCPETLDYSDVLEPTSNLFVDDTNARAFINSCSYLPDDIRKQLCKKIVSFQKDYSAPDGYYYVRNDCPRTNDNTIKHFINKCTFNSSNRRQWISATPENMSLLEKLKQDLLRHYAY